MRSHWVRLLPLALLGACALQPDGSPAPDPGAGDIQELLVAPGEIEIDGRRLVLDGISWRDFMPGVGPPRENGLIVIGRVEDPEQKALPWGLEIERLWVIKGDELWAPAELERPPQPWNWRHEKVARDGPLWEPGSIVHVIVRVVDAGGETWLLRDEDQVSSVW